MMPNDIVFSDLEEDDGVSFSRDPKKPTTEDDLDIESNISQMTKLSIKAKSVVVPNHQNSGSVCSSPRKSLRKDFG